MKNIKLLAGILLIFSVFIFNSCDNEPVDPGLNVDDFNQSCKTPTNFQVSNFIDATSVLNAGTKISGGLSILKSTWIGGIK